MSSHYYLNIQSYRMTFYRYILINIYYICAILHFRQIISWRHTTKFRFILIILLYFKFSLRMMRHLTIWPALIVLSPALNVNLPAFVAIVPLPDNIFHNKLAPNVPNNMLKKSLFLFSRFIFNCFAKTLYH